MAVPTKPEIDFSYTAFAQGLGTGQFPGTQLDNDLANVADAVAETIDFVSLVVRADGKLGNGTVVKSSLDTSVQLGIAPPRPWATGRAYAVDETVTINNSLFICVTAHSSTSFATDQATGKWGLIAEFTVPAAIADAAVTETKHETGGVSTRALADGSVTEVKHATGGVSLRALELAIVRALTPIGLEADFAGVVAPAGWLFEFGQTVSRVTYSGLFNVLCPVVSVVTTSGSPVLTGVGTDLRGLGLEGVTIEGANIVGGATIVSLTADTITMSANATGSAAGSARVFPWGAGDNATTFNLPDARDRTSIGRGNMGGAAAGRITAAGAGNPGLGTGRLGAVGGVDRHALIVAQMPSHGHTNSVSTDGSHTHPLSYLDWGPQGGASPFANFYGSGSFVLSNFTRTATTDASGSHTHTVTINNSGSGEAHPNLQPSRVTNKIIFTGVV